MDNYFSELYGIDVSQKIEKKNNLSYLSWAWAWAELKKRHPSANYKIYERDNGVNYFTDGRTCWVKVGVTIPCNEMLDARRDAYTYEPIEHIEYLPVMDYRNQSIPLEKVTSFDVNKSIQRALTKAIARHGIGLFIYAGEDLPEEPAPAKTLCSKCGDEIVDAGGATAAQLITATKQKYGKPICKQCIDLIVADRAKAEAEKAKAEAPKPELNEAAIEEMANTGIPFEVIE